MLTKFQLESPAALVPLGTDHQACRDAMLSSVLSSLVVHVLNKVVSGVLSNVMSKVPEMCEANHAPDWFSSLKCGQQYARVKVPMPDSSIQARCIDLKATAVLFPSLMNCMAGQSWHSQTTPARKSP